MSTFSNDLNVRKAQYQSALTTQGDYTECEVQEMSLAELRAAIDELYPIVITQSSTTMTGGKTKKVTVVRVA